MCLCVVVEEGVGGGVGGGVGWGVSKLISSLFHCRCARFVAYSINL